MLTLASCAHRTSTLVSSIHRTRFHRISRVAWGMTDQPVKRQKTAMAAYTMDINLAVTTDYEVQPLSKIAKAPVTALQGIGPKSAEALSMALGVETVEDLASNKFFKMASAIAALSDVANGKRKEECIFNIDKAVMADHEEKTIQEICDAPLSTLQGLIPEKAELLDVMQVKTVQDLAELKYAKWAQAIVYLADFEE